MIQRVILLVLVFLLFGLSGCIRISHWGVPSTIPLEPGSYETLGPVKGESCVFYFLGIIPMSELNNSAAAMKNALSKKPGATAMVQVTSDNSQVSYIIVSEACTIIEGIAVKGK